jgi:hypothetical protein
MPSFFQSTRYFICRSRARHFFACPPGSESDISRAIARSAAEFCSKEEEQVVSRAETAVHNAISQLDASYQSSGRSKFVNGLADFGRAWVHVRLARLSLAAMAGAEGELLKNMRLTPF